MIFVYPAIVSEHVKNKIAVAVSKAIEQFYLTNLLQSFTSGTLRIKTIFNPSKDVYGPLVLENKKIFGASFLQESEIKTYGKYSFKEPDTPDYSTYGEAAKSETSEELKRRVAELHNYEAELGQIRRKILKAIDEMDADIKSQKGTTVQANQSRYLDKAKGHLEDYQKIVERKAKFASDLRRSFSDLVKEKDKDPFAQRKDNREQEKADKEKEKEKLSQYETHGSYKVEQIPGITFAPTMANIDIKIHYVGGPHEIRRGAVSGKETSGFHQIAVGCKVLPVRVSNFEKIEDAILDDYFSKSSIMFFKIQYRKFLRGSVRFVERLVKKLSGKDVDALSKMNPLIKDVLLAPQGYVNASSFKRKGTSAAFYNYSSAVVIINKDDLTRDVGTNFFLNRAKLNKMFKAGWNSFCIMDDIKEEALFISAIDGGHLHALPYAYIFNSLKMDLIYANLDELQRRTPVFRRKMGNMRNLVTRLKRESALKASITKLITS